MTALYLHEDVKELLAGKTLVVIGDSVERSIYKDLVLLLQENRYLKDAELRKKGEESFLGDELVYGGCKGEMKNSIHYRECRYFKTEDEACCRYYFVTICYGDYVEEVLQELSLEPTDIIVMNSCLWDVHRHGKKGIEQYEENLEKLVASLRRLLPDCLFLWLTTPPVDIKSKGGFLMRPGQDLVKINEVRYCNQIAREVFSAANEIDRRFRIVDLGYVFQYFEHHRASDGVHWNEKAHRRISNLILEEVAKAFNMEVPRLLPAPYENPQLPPSSSNMFDDMNMDRNMSFQGAPNAFDFNGHIQNEWQYEHNMHPPFERPPGPPHGYPFPPPRGPPPHPFGPIDYMRPSFMNNGGYPDGIRDLDDLGDARRQVEERLKTHQYSEPNLSNTKEKNYRFGVPNDQLAVSSLKRKLSSSSNEPSNSKVTIIEEEEGNMKKLVKLSDGTTLHSVMTDKEKEEYKKKQAKLQQEKEAKEKAEQLRKEREEKERAEKEERERKRREEEEKKAAEEAANFAKLKEVDLTALPTVSEVPAEKEDKIRNKENETKSKVSNFANKLLSLIKNPINKVFKDKPVKADLVNIPNALSQLKAYEDEDSFVSKDTGEIKNENNITTSLPNISSLNSTSTNTFITTANEATPKKVNTLALLSMQSPFATTKPLKQAEASTEPPPPGTEDCEPPPPGTEDLSSELMHLPQLPPNLIPAQTQFKKVEKSSPNENNATVNNTKADTLEVRQVKQESETNDKQFESNDEDDEVNELLKNADDTEISDVDDSILDENFESKPKEDKDVTNETEKPPEEAAANIIILNNGSQKENIANASIVKENLSESAEDEPSQLIASPTVEQAKKKRKVDEEKGSLNVSQSLEASSTEESPMKKKKKKVRDPNETKEQRAERRRLKREKKERIRKEKERVRQEKERNEKEKAETSKSESKNSSSSNKIEVVKANEWSKPFSHNNYQPRHRSATWTQLYQHPYNKSSSAPLYKQQFVVNQTGGINAATYVVNPYHAANQHALQKQQELLIEQQRQQQLLQQQIAQQQMLQQQSALLRQQQNTPSKTEDKTQQNSTSTLPTTSQHPQLYIDEYGQTYTLEEETFLIGPGGEIQNISSGLGVANNLLQQQQQQQSQQQTLTTQQQYSLLYQQQQAARFL